MVSKYQSDEVEHASVTLDDSFIFGVEVSTTRVEVGAEMILAAMFKIS